MLWLQRRSQMLTDLLIKDMQIQKHHLRLRKGEKKVFRYFQKTSRRSTTGKATGKPEPSTMLRTLNNTATVSRSQRPQTPLLGTRLSEQLNRNRKYTPPAAFVSRTYSYQDART